MPPPRKRGYTETAEPRWRLRCIAGPCNQSIDYSRPMPRTFFPSALAPANAGYAASLAENRIVGCNERSGPPAPLFQLLTNPKISIYGPKRSNHSDFRHGGDLSQHFFATNPSCFVVLYNKGDNLPCISQRR